MPNESKVDRLEVVLQQIGSESFEAVRHAKNGLSPALPDRMKSVLFSSARARLAGSCSKGRNKPECGRSPLPIITSVYGTPNSSLILRTGTLGSGLLWNESSPLPDALEAATRNMGLADRITVVPAQSGKKTV